MIKKTEGSNGKINSVLYEYKEVSESTYDKYVISNFIPVSFKCQINALENLSFITNKYFLMLKARLLNN